jgi:hypothetical protein
MSVYTGRLLVYQQECAKKSAIIKKDILIKGHYKN